MSPPHPRGRAAGRVARHRPENDETWRAQLLRYAMLSKNWLPALDLFFALHGQDNVITSGITVVSVARYLSASRGRGTQAFLRHFKPEKYCDTNEDRIELKVPDAHEYLERSRAFLTIARLATSIQDISIYTVHKSLGEE